MSRALALDTMANSFTRLIGPMAAGAIYQALGHRRSPTRCRLASIYRGHPGRRTALPAEQPQDRAVGHVPRELAEGVRFARGHVTIGGVLAVTIAMNLLGFCYSALVAPIGRQVFDGVADAGRHARRRRSVRRAAGRAVADQRRAAAERAHADGRRLAAVPGLRDR